MTARPDDGEFSEDRALVRRCLRGEVAAIEEFYDAHSRYVLDVIRRTLRGVGADRSRLEDIRQEVFLHLFDGTLSKYRGECPLHLYVRLVAHRRTVDEIRKRGGSRGTARNPAALGDVDPVARERDPTETEEQLRCIALMQKLAPACFKLLALRWIDDMKPREIARLLGESSQTVRKRLQRCRERFRGLLGEHGWSPAR